VTFSQEPTTMQWARSRPFDSEGDEHGLRGRSEIAQAQKPPTA
jgi:hypothetical protein